MAAYCCKRHTLSVLVPTKDRPSLLKISLESVFQNRFRPIHLLVSDQSVQQDTMAMIGELICPDGIGIEYRRGPLICTQSANVNFLFDICGTDLCILMHDDDYFLDGGIDTLLAAWLEAPDDIDAVFGKQVIVDKDGRTLEPETAINDSYYFKDRPYICKQSRLASALIGQFPNNGMLMRSAISRRARYPGEDEVGFVPVDFHFSLRYALVSKGRYVCVPNYTTAYRLTEHSVWRSAKKQFDGHLGFQVLNTVPVDSAVETWALGVARNRFAASAVMGYLWHGQRWRSWRVFMRHVLWMDKPVHVRIALILFLCASTLGISPEWIANLAKRSRTREN